MVLDVDRYDPAPPDLDLQQVHVYVRHGERTPVSPRLTQYIPPLWPLCRTSFLTYANLILRRPNSDCELLPPQHPDAGWHHVGVVRMERVAEVPAGHDDGRGHHFDELEHACGFGQLTDRGVISTSLFGSALRNLYVDKLKFLSQTYSPESNYFRSTDMPRTIASLQHIISHLYPPWMQPPGFMVSPPRIYVRFPTDEDLMQNQACDRFRTLRRFWEAAAVPRINPLLDHLNEKLSKYIDGRPIRLDGHPRLSGLLDTIKAATAHEVDVPAEFTDPETIKLMESAVVAEWFGGYRNPEIRTLGIGRMLDDLRRTMARKIALGEDDDPLRMRIHSTHDTMIATTLISLDAFDGRWPPFTSSILVELFRKKPGRASEPRDPSQYFVRTRYQNGSLSLPACSTPSAHYPGHPELCTFAAFSQLVDTMTPRNWREQCSVPVTEEPEFGEGLLFPHKDGDDGKGSHEGGPDGIFN